LNTVVSFLIKHPPPEYIRSRFEASKGRGLPYLVAEVETSENRSQVAGFAYASAFRGYMLGYGATVEMSIFCHPEHLGKGAGSGLMCRLLQSLRETNHIFSEAGHEDEPQEFAVKQVLAVMSVDDEKPDKGLGLRDWYVKWGFEQVGRLRKVGLKNGRWIDTIYLQLSL